MGFIASSERRNLFWFGTEQRAQFIRTPNSGAEVSSQGWEAGGGLLNGGAYQLNSFGSHREYVFEWPGSSSRKLAQLMTDYKRGTYGRGLIYFQDPLTFDTNVLPAMWADPSLGLGEEGSSLIYGVNPIQISTSNWQVNELPILSAQYSLSTVTPGWRDNDSVFIPIPDGYTLSIGSFHSFTGTGAVYYRTQTALGSLGPLQTIPALPATSPTLFSHTIPNSGIAGIRLQVGRTSPAVSTITLTAMIARLSKTGGANPPSFSAGPWMGGQGNSGCRFIGNPTYINNTGVDGGQVGFAASFREVGSWLYG